MFQRAGRPPSPFIAYLDGAGIRCCVLPDNGPLDLGLPARLARALDRFRPDILQSHGYRTTALVFLLRLMGRRTPWLAFFHGRTSENWKVRLYHGLDRALMQLADRIVVMAESQRGEFASMSRQVRIIHNAALEVPADGEPVSLDGLRTAGDPVVAVVGRLSPEKGVDLLLEAVARLDAGGLPVALAVAGDGPERERLDQQARALGIVDRIRFLGNVANVPSLYRQVDAVALPSRSEGLPNVLLEALRADVPVVATAVGGVPEVLVDPNAGVVVPAGDPAVLAEGIRTVLATGRSAAAKAARTEVTRRFSLGQRVSRHLALYAELRADRRPGAPRVPAAAAPLDAAERSPSHTRPRSSV
jgi:glycosyltransferase involved in cell wall biosynthesis